MMMIDDDDDNDDDVKYHFDYHNQLIYIYIHIYTIDKNELQQMLYYEQENHICTKEELEASKDKCNNIRKRYVEYYTVDARTYLLLLLYFTQTYYYCYFYYFHYITNSFHTITLSLWVE
jgi:hypothetical protein